MRTPLLLLVSLSLFSLNTLAEDHSTDADQNRSQTSEYSDELRGALSKQTTESGQKKLVFFPTKKVSQVEFSPNEFGGQWTPLLENNNSDPISYYSEGYKIIEPGRVFLVRYVTEEGNRLAFQFIIGEDGKTVEISAYTNEPKGEFEEKITPKPTPFPTTTSGESKKVDSGSLDENTILYGAGWVDPQTLAQARADYMASRGLQGHLGSGFVMTTQGRLSEGTGWGQGVIPSTCIAKDGSAAVADAHASGSSGIHRVRLYNCPSGTYDPTEKPVKKILSGGGLFRRRR